MLSGACTDSRNEDYLRADICHGVAVTIKAVFFEGKRLFCLSFDDFFFIRDKNTFRSDFRLPKKSRVTRYFLDRLVENGLLKKTVSPPFFFETDIFVPSGRLTVAGGFILRSGIVMVSPSHT
jgi:hypothetical protein